MNNKGQTIFVTLMISIVIISFILIAIGGIKVVTDDIIGSSGLDCSNSTIPSFQKIQCTIIDLTQPYFFFMVLGLAIAIISARIIFEVV